MKKRTLLVLLIAVIIINMCILAFAAYDLKLEIDLINIWIRDGVWERLKDHRIPYLTRAIINLAFSIISLVIVSIFTIFCCKQERLILTEEEKQKIKNERELRTTEKQEKRRQQKILQLSAKIEKLKNEDDE